MSRPSPERPSLTDQQSAAVLATSANVALSAGAGCGKTSVLTERFLTRLELPARAGLRGLVALTFTDKAARELRERVRDACRNRMAVQDDPARWRAITRGLEAAPIGTFHAFCARILRRYAIAAGVDPAFTILDPALVPTISDEALGTCLRNWLAEKNADLKALAEEFGLNEVRLYLADLVENHVADDLKDWPNREPDDILTGWKLFWRDKLQPRLIREFVDSTEVQNLLQLLRHNACSHSKMRERQQFLLDAVPRLMDEDDPGPTFRLIEENAKVQAGGGAKAWASEEIYDDVKKGLEKLRATAKKIGNQLTLSEAAESCSKAMAVLGARFARLAIDAQRSYDQVKQERGVLDYDDLLRKTRDLLKAHADEVRRELALGEGAILVDEFQDTDPVQGEILQLLAGESFRESPLFLVGDEKQSIYRFRNARPEIFRDFGEQFPDDGCKSLNENFRSAPGIIDFVNHLFADTFSGEVHKLLPSPRTPPRAEEPVVEFLWADETNGGGGSAPVDQRRAIEARWIARRLLSGLDKQWTVRDRETNVARPAQPGDIALLFRSLTDLAIYEQALNQEGLQTYVLGGTSFYYQQEVQDLANVLSVLEDPLDAVALAGLLRSPFVSVSDEGLFWLSVRPQEGLVAGFTSVGSIENLKRSDRERLGRAQEQLAQWRAVKDRLPIAQVVERVLDESGYEASLLAEPLGPRRWANVRKLVRLARRFDAQGMALADFVARLRADLRRPPREEQAATTDEGGDCVRLMSIHQAKGLEFPIVVIPDLDRGTRNNCPRVAFRPELGMVVRPPSDGEYASEENSSEDSSSGEQEEPVSLGCRTYDLLEDFEEADEALRLFYVAITRARDFVILSAGQPASGKVKSHALKLLDRRFCRATGEFMGAEAEPSSSQRLVQVCTRCPETVSTRDARRARPQPVSVARAIEVGIRGLPPQEEPAASEVHVSWMSLDPARWLRNSAAQVDRLIRLVLADPASSDVIGLERGLTRAARLQNPAASAAIVAAAEDRLRLWLRSRLAQRLAAATEIHRAVAWSLPWPGAGSLPLVLHGRLDFAVRDSHGAWEVVNLTLPGLPELVERLRLLLSARAVKCLGIDAVVRGWSVSLDRAQTPLEVDTFDDASIESALEAVLDELKRSRP